MHRIVAQPSDVIDEERVKFKIMKLLDIAKVKRNKSQVLTKITLIRAKEVVNVDGYLIPQSNQFLYM